MIEVHGAYGRSYDSFEKAKFDWDDLKDFKIKNGPYMHKNERNALDSVVIFINGKMEFLEVGYV